MDVFLNEQHSRNMYIKKDSEQNNTFDSWKREQIFTSAMHLVVFLEFHFKVILKE